MTERIAAAFFCISSKEIGIFIFHNNIIGFRKFSGNLFGIFLGDPPLKKNDAHIISSPGIKFS